MVDKVEEVVDPFVEEQVDWRAVHQLYAFVGKRPRVAVEDTFELDRVLLESCEHALLPGPDAGEGEMESDQGLARSRGPGYERGGALPKPVREHLVEKRHPGGGALEDEVVGVDADGVGHSRVNGETLGLSLIHI